jgi:hypothetical protein
MTARVGDQRFVDYAFRGRDLEFCPEALGPETKKKIIDELVQLRHRGVGLTNSTRFLEDYRRYLLTDRCSWRCEAGTLCLDVMPDGSVCGCKEKPPIGNILDADFIRSYLSGERLRKVAEISERCSGCFYGEYREPQYAVRDLSVLKEWTRDWFLTFRHGMRFRERL